MEELLSTKLFIPSTRSELVSRPRLIKRLNEGLGRKLTLISAPAGFGKTTLVSEWVAECGKSVAWLSLEQGDNVLVRFLIYLSASLQTVDPKLASAALNQLQSSQPPPVETTLTSLINAVAALPDKVILILDDYHLIETESIHDGLSFLLENLPPQLHLVIITREDPLLPLSRLRARGQMTELRAADLRFTPQEAAEFLNQVMGLNLSFENVSALESRTEGWIAGLQLAAISLQEKENTTELIKSFSGSHRLVLDYLIEEVLTQQSEHIRSFLLRTSILNHLTGPLCNALTGGNDGQEVLESLDRANLFIVPLDEERRWYRYHHLFVSLLRQRLHQEHHELVSELHQHASEWYEQKNLWSDAIHHAFAIENLERVADLAELAWDPMNKSYQAVTWLGWVKKLPDDLVRSRPALSTGCGWASLDAGDLKAAEHYLQDAELWLETAANTNEKLEVPLKKKKAFDEEEFRALSTSVANARAYLAQALGDVSGTEKYARRAIYFLREDDYFDRGLAKILLGFAYWASGKLEAARVVVADAVADMQMTGRVLFVISFTSYLVDIMTSQGCLRESERTYLQILEKLTEQDQQEIPETAVVHLGLSEIYLEQGDMEAAKRHLGRSEAFGEQLAFAPWYRHWICAHVRMMAAKGDWDGVFKMLEGAEGLYYRHPIPDVRPLKAILSRAWLAQGKLTDAQNWVHEQNLSFNDELSYLREFEHITLAKVLITQYKNDRNDNRIQDAISLLERLLKAAEDEKRFGSRIEILVLQALAYEAQGDIPHALVPLKRALALAEPEGYFHIFVGEGSPMAHLLYEALSRKISPEYVHRLLGAFPVEEPEKEEASRLHGSGSQLIEPLSERELEILQLISEGLTNQKIGGKLYLSLNTVKAHTRNIYGKLAVSSRTQAVAKARILGLLSSFE